MALTISAKMLGSVGGKMIVNAKITHDGSTLTFTAGSVGMHCIEYILGNNTYTSMQAPASTFLKMQFASIGTDGAWVGFAGSDANGKSVLTLLGW